MARMRNVGLPLSRFYPELGNSMLALRDRNHPPGADRCHGREGSHHERTTNAPVDSHFRSTSALIFEEGSPGRRGFRLACTGRSCKEPFASSSIRHLLRDDIPGMPELSEVDVIRHFTRLSTWNYHIDLGLYPLGSCTMKYNPKINERMARLDGFALAHPFMPAELIQGALEIQKISKMCLAEISGMDAVTLQPAAGAHGELTGILMIRAYHEVARQSARRRF